MNKDIYDLTFQAEEDHFWYVGRRQVIIAWLERSLKNAGYPASGLRILDYGCGTGINLLHFARFGDVVGVDTAAEAIAYCRQRGLDNAIWLESLDDVESASDLGRAFDVVTMLDVLEHIPDEAATLRRIHALLKPGGHLLVTVPAYNWLWSGEDDVSQHVRRYTARSLSRVLTEAGYERVNHSYFNTFLLPLQAAVALSHRWQRATRKPTSLVKPLPPMLNRALSKVIFLESRALRALSFPFGASIICTARAKGYA
jgi:2-polyprenyl-3-methyl-5-hydroxy-6-metoxy-1,4-benzoquinol methylase